MSSSITFTGAGFSVLSANQDVVGTVRVKYSSVPKALSSAGSNDALNTSNYSLSGPGTYSIVAVQPVSGDALSYDLILSAGLSVGTWRVNVTNVQTPGLNALTPPTSAQFQVTSAAAVASFNGGAQDDNAESIIRKHLGSALQGDNWNALIKGLALSDDKNWLNAKLAFDQLFASSASEGWLEKRASDRGITKPSSIGLDDELFRQLIIKTSSNKVVHEAIREILEIYYGRDSSRAFVEATIEEPYNLTGDLDLTWTIDEKETFSHTFSSSEFGSISAAKAIEVAFAITKAMRDLGSRGFAIAYQSTISGSYKVRIYSGSLGLGSFVRVNGGTAQNKLGFPSLLTTYSGAITSGNGYTWSYTRPDASSTRVSLAVNTAGGPAIVDLSQVQSGDYVVIGSDAQIGSTGTYPIKNVSVSWSGAIVTQSFDIDTIPFNSTALQLSNSAYTFYRPTKQSIVASGGRTIVVAQTRPGRIDIRIPATTQIVKRGAGRASYGRVNDSIDIARLIRDTTGLATVSTKTSHGLSVGDKVRIEGFAPSMSLPFITPNSGNSLPGSYASLVGESTTPTATLQEGASVLRLAGGQILLSGGFTRAAGAISNSTGFLSSGAGTDSAVCNRYAAGASSIISNATEANGARQSSQTWVATNSLISARQQHSSSQYGTGAIASGGMQAPSTILNSAEIYTLNGSWSATTNMSNARAGHQQVTLNNGNVIVMGGANTEGTALNTTEIYNGTSWSFGPSMNVPRTDFQAVKLSNGNVMVLGGRVMGLGHRLDQATLALWKLDETSGTSIADSSGAYPLTATNSPTPSTQGKVNGCWNFSPANSYLTGAGNANAISKLLGEWTIELWFKPSTSALGHFITYGGSSETLADNILANTGIDATGRLFWKWENGAGIDVSQTTTNPATTEPSYRAGWFNHFALRKAFTSPQEVRSGSRASNVTTITFASAHGFSVSDVVYFNSGNEATFSSGSKTVTAATTNTISYAETGSDIVYSMLSGFVGKNYDVSIFLNGSLLQTWTNQPNASGGTSAAWFIARQPETSVGFNGLLDDIRVSSIARNEAEIRESFYRSWGNQKEAAAPDRAIGALTDTTEIYDGVSWTFGPRMALARCFHRAAVLPGDVVVVHGGLGHDPTTIPPISNKATIGLWPSNSLREIEIYDPAVGRWSSLSSSGVRRHGHVLAFSSANNRLVVMGGNSLNQNTSDVDDAGYVETFNLSTRTWKSSPGRYKTSYGDFNGEIGSIQLIAFGGFDLTGASNTKALVWVSASEQISGPGINGLQTVTAVPDSKTFQFTTTKTTLEKTYTSSHGSSYRAFDTTSNQIRTLGNWLISTASRSSNVTTAVLSFPTGYSTHGISVGDYVYVNSTNAFFGSGLKLVTAVTTNSISYAETASDQASVSVVGSVSQGKMAGTSTATKAKSQTANDPGPYLFDPQNGLAVTSTEAVTATFPLSKGQNYEEVELDDSSGAGSLFPDSNGFIVFGFGTSSQVGPVKYLGRYKSSASKVRLVLDYSHRLEFDQPIGTKVTLLSQREPYGPTNQPGSFYLTPSSAGRIAAQSSIQDALAAGVESNVTVVYPGDRGLGGEGKPTHSAQKLSDVVGIFAGDDEKEEVQEARGS